MRGLIAAAALLAGVHAAVDPIIIKVGRETISTTLDADVCRAPNSFTRRMERNCKQAQRKVYERC